MNLFNGLVSECMDYIPARYNNSWTCLITTRNGGKFWDKDMLTGQVMEFETEEQAQEYCDDMMNLVRVLNESKDSL